MALWGGRFSQSVDRRFKQFNDSLRFDYRLAKFDIIGSIAWSYALLSVDILSKTEQQIIEQALIKIKDDVALSPDIMLTSDAEDVHSWVESQLILRIGELGKKLHTGRSRNDQVATSLKLWCREQGQALLLAIDALQQQIILLADEHQCTVFPGFTHLQRAQPIIFGHWCLAYEEMLSRDYARLTELLYRLETCPLGSGALAGTTYAIDREQLAHRLGFRRATRNSLDSVSDRDHVVEFISLASLSMLHLSRMAEDLIFYNSGEANFVGFSDKVTSGSSLMPQKKNPDALELIRGKTGRVYGAMSSIMMTLKALPLAYNKDMQEDKEGLFDALDTWHDCLSMLTLCLSEIKINEESSRQAAMQGYSNSTELADYLVSKGIAFRRAHHIVGEIVLFAMQKQQPLEALSLAQLQQFSPDIKQDVFDVLTIESCLERRCALGGVAPMQIHYALSQAKLRLKKRSLKDITVRNARLTDLDNIESMVARWADLGENLPRERNELMRNIGSFVVTEHQGKVTGCGSLYVYDSGLAEVRSLSVDLAWQNKGQGQAIVQHILQKAKSMAIQKVFVLTRVPDFFIRQGFIHTSKALLPEKVMKDCEYCPRLHACDEVALVISFERRVKIKTTLVED